MKVKSLHFFVNNIYGRSFVFQMYVFEKEKAKQNEYRFLQTNHALPQKILRSFQANANHSSQILKPLLTWTSNLSGKHFMRAHLGINFPSAWSLGTTNHFYNSMKRYSFKIMFEKLEKQLK